MRGQPVSEEERRRIQARYCELIEGGLGAHAARAQVGEEFGVGSATVWRVHAEAKGERARGRVGRPLSLTLEEVDQVVTWIREDPTLRYYDLLRRVESELNKPVSEGTLRLRLRERGLKKNQVAVVAKAGAEKGAPATRYTARHRRVPEGRPHRPGYPSDLTNAEWEVLEPLLMSGGAGSPTRYELRDIVDAILYQTRTGCPWRYLPSDLPHYKTVFRYYTNWTRSGLLDRVHTKVRELVRQQDGRTAQPSAAIIDGQTVKSVGTGKDVGFDGNKKIKGRKRTLVTDTLGLILAICVTAANVHDTAVAATMLDESFSEEYPAVRRVWGDLGYQGPLERAINANPALPFELEVVRRPGAGGSGTWEEDNTVISPPTPDRPFPILRRRWVIERTNGWNMQWRRVRLDYEQSPEASGARVIWASLGRMMARLSP